jgi:hypothetical protein
MMAIKRLKDDKVVCLHTRLISISRSTGIAYQCLHCGKMLTDIEAGSLIQQDASEITQHMMMPSRHYVSHIGFA